MPFFLILGSYVPSAGIPDGDSVRFRADQPDQWKKLEGHPVEKGTGAKTKGTVQLRLEGIDAIEKGAIQPLATQARDSLFKLIGYTKGSGAEPRGYVLSRMTDDKSGRPICFAFVGDPPKGLKRPVRLTGPLLRKSVNYKQAAAGHAYPLYYNTLFAELRREFAKAVAAAKAGRGKGYWPTDASTKGVTVKTKDDLKTIPPVWPKLWRRLEEYLRKKKGLRGFHDFLEKKNERLDIMSEMSEVGLQEIVKVTGNKVRLTVPPEDIRVGGKAGKRNRAK